MLSSLLLITLETYHQLAIELHSNINFFIGDNGSGKSSFLEALFFIGHGKSFRTSKVEHLASYETDNFVVSVRDVNDLQLRS